MKRDRFIAVLREECALKGWRLVVDTRLGKGSHYRLEVWDGDTRMLAKTTLKSGDLSPLYEKLVRKQLGLGVKE